MDLNGATKIKNSYLLIAAVITVVLLICLFGYRGWANRLSKELEAKNNIIELLQEDYNDALEV